jgi:hypothetical protein
MKKSQLTLMSNTEKYFESAINKIKDETVGMARSLPPATWKLPFRCTLELRPRMQLNDESSVEDCDACWQRGDFHCRGGGMFSFTTERGTYNPVTFEVCFMEADGTVACLTDRHRRYQREERKSHTLNKLVSTIVHSPRSFHIHLNLNYALGSDVRGKRSACMSTSL